jgi:hypothetical protein
MRGEQACKLIPRPYAEIRLSGVCPEIEPKSENQLSLLIYGGPGGTRTPNQAVMSRRL